MKNLMHCVVLYGEIGQANQAWNEWISLAKIIEIESEIKFTHIGISSDSMFHSKRILTIDKALRKFSKTNTKIEIIKSFEFYSLPHEYKQAAFDYIAYMVMCLDPFPLVLISLPKGSESIAIIDKSTSIVSTFFTISSGLVFEMSKEDCPFFFATKMNQPSSYESLNILKNI